jgi:hypothetical protein
MFSRPVQDLLDGIKGAADKLIPKIKNILNIAPESPPAPAGTPPPAPTPAPAAAPSAPSSSTSTPGTSGIGRSSLLGGLVGGTMDTMQGEDITRAYSGNIAGAGIAGAAANIASKVPGPAWFKLAASIGTGLVTFGPAVDFSKGIVDKFTEIFNPGSDAPDLNKNLLSKASQNKITPIAFGTENSISGAEQQSDAIANANQQDFTQPPQYGEINVNQLTGQMPFAESMLTAELQVNSSSTSDAQIMPIKQEGTMKAESVGPLPEPSPTIIPLPIPGSSRISKTTKSSQTGMEANSVPFINAENSGNNIYLTYAHIVYNVPMT